MRIPLMACTKTAESYCFCYSPLQEHTGKRAIKLYKHRRHLQSTGEAGCQRDGRPILPACDMFHNVEVIRLRSDERHDRRQGIAGLLIIIYRGYALYFTLYFCADMQWLKTLTFISETEKNIIVIIVFNKWKIHKVMLIAIWCKMVKGTIFKHSIQYGFMYANFDFCLHCCQNFLKIQNRFLIIPWGKSFLLYLQVRHSG